MSQPPADVILVVTQDGHRAANRTETREVPAQAGRMLRKTLRRGGERRGEPLGQHEWRADEVTPDLVQIADLDEPDVHFAERDPLRSQVTIDALGARVAGSGSAFHQHTYPCAGHLFADAGLAAYDAAAAEAMWSNVVAFVDRLAQHTCA